MIHSRRIVTGLVAALALLIAPTVAQAATNAPQYYVSLGDSYASGYQPSPSGGIGSNSRAGFAYQTVTAAAKRGYRYKLVNFGCAGATTTSLLKSVGCSKFLLGPGAPSYPKLTQVAAAERFLRAHRGHVGLITVSIGGNDVTACVRDPTTAVACVAKAVGTIRANVTRLAKRLRKAAGPKVRIVGITYPDVILGLSLRPGGTSLATLSVTAFRALINPALRSSYATVHGRFVDVTAATGAYGPLTQTTTLAPYGTIPVPVAKVCTLTWFCAVGDIHARRDGYALIANLIAGTLPNRK